MGNQPATEEQNHVEPPVICCGDNPKKQPLEEASPNVMNLGRNTQSSLIKSFSKNGLQNDQHLNMQDTGSTYYKDSSVIRRPENILQQTNSTNQKQKKQNQPNLNAYQSQMKKSGVSTFKKSYGGFNSFNSMGAYNSHGMHNSKLTEAKQQDPKNHKPLPLVDFVGQKDLRRSKVQNTSSIIGLGKYCGPCEQFDSNKKIIEFLQYSHIKDPQFKFYDTKDHHSLLNTSTVGLVKKKSKNDMYLDEASTSNIQLNSTLTKLQEPIQVTLDVDSKIILATFILALGITVLILGIHFGNGTDVIFFVCLMGFIFLYIVHLLMCYIYNDILEYLYNVREFSNFNEDFQMLRKQEGNFSFHLDLVTSNKHIKQCYMLSKDNRMAKIRQVQNQNKDLNIKELAGKKCTTLLIKYKTKTSFVDPESQFNTLNYFDQYLNAHKDELFQKGKPPKQKQNQKTNQKQTSKSKAPNKQVQHPHHRHYKAMLRQARFDYQLDTLPLFTKKAQSIIPICYMDQDDGGCIMFFFVICTLFGFCLPFLIIFQSYIKRYRINLLNKFRV